MCKNVQVARPRSSTSGGQSAGRVAGVVPASVAATPATEAAAVEEYDDPVDAAGRAEAPALEEDGSSFA